MTINKHTLIGGIFLILQNAASANTGPTPLSEPSASTPDSVTTLAASVVNSDRVDTLFLIICAAMVFLMQPGFLLVELGLSRSKNALNIIMKNVVDVCVAMLTFMFIGFGLMFANGNGFIGMDFQWLSSADLSNKFWAFWLFQATFVGAVSTIASGAMAERTRFQGYIIYTVVLSAIIYPVLAHWSWGSLASGLAEGFGQSKGFLENMGFSDFAGSTVVHSVGGAAALAGIIVLGPRKGRFNEDGNPVLMTGHNIPMAALGVMLLWFGWIGFNGGSLLSVQDGLGIIIVNTMIAAAAGGIFAMAVFWLMHGRPDPGIVLNGILGGLVAITACANVVNPMSAVIIGIIAGIISSLGADLLLKFKLDDVAGAVPVHLMNGIWGTVAVSLFNLNGFSIDQLGIQLLGSLATVSAAFTLCFITFKIIDLTIGLRATDEEQIAGLDFSEHATNAYPDFAAPNFDDVETNAEDDDDFGFDNFGFDDPKESVQQQTPIT